MTLLRPTAYGDFVHQTVTGAFRNDLSQLHPGDRHFGLEQKIEYVYGFLQAQDGRTICLEQKFVGSVSTGTFVMMTDGRGGLDVQPETTRSYRGEVRRTIEDDRRVWADPVMLRLPEGVRRSDDLPYLLELHGDSLVWDQGELCRLEGEVRTLGVQFYSASAREPVFFTSIPYWVEGPVLGHHVSGLLYLDRVFLKPGTEWKETAMFTDIQISWNIFGNQYDDGSIEYGKIVVGHDGFNAGMVVEGDEVLASTPQVEASYELNAAEFVSRAIYDLGSGIWEFTGDETGNMTEFSASRWNGYHAQFGLTQRTDDPRRIVSGFTWLESFPARMREAGLVAEG